MPQTAIAKKKPDWAGEDWLSRLVNLLIKTKPLYSLMKYQARQVLIKTAEKNGIPWRQTVKDFDQAQAEQYFQEIADPELEYPNYYNVPFHAYDAGNLCWKAAVEAAPATESMALRVWKNEPLTPDIAQARLRNTFLEAMAEYLPNEVNDVLDIGCSVGISTVALHEFLKRRSPDVKTIGFDLSPYMLAVAKIRNPESAIQWQHGKAEATKFADNSFDVITLQFVLHELPNQATREIFQECLRILRPGGCLAIVDNNPKSPVIQSLPPALFVLMKSTEPWSDEYYTFDVEDNLKQGGFDYLATVPSDPRHRTIIARKPL
ncbi:class I SAM-dependent methyltransferase [[Limnothrix rosea] IAM M-220]|uniref:class I SAM-dependent methyltransferase n=1 Tax=[Limnothrix rosea] IAM M-220 TaxID=454133 RepID=UPI00095F1DF4|nr:class I SAM-dependent methyltransferase [[Limnothrix rosea] IAM M-220]OKH16962.1 SAM-dependent methyltransferase [[Limnothrix rosea] IAM M-220]